MSFETKINNEITIDDDRSVRVEIQKEDGIKLTWFNKKGPVEMATSVNLTREAALITLEALEGYREYLDEQSQ